jgi:antibiotic biosynthesis monooxygenase (ABM) superfamily enzyme
MPWPMPPGFGSAIFPSRLILSTAEYTKSTGVIPHVEPQREESREEDPRAGRFAMSGSMTPANHSQSAAALVVKIRLRPSVDAGFSSWHAKMSVAPANVSGFVNAEVNAPAPGESEWRIVQRFRSLDDLRAWRTSEPHDRLLREASELADGTDGPAVREDEIADGVADGVVTEVITTYVKAGKDRDYQEWAEKVHQIEAQFPGYRGGSLQPPSSERQGYWTSLVRFASPEQLDVWLNSPERRELLSQHEKLVQSWEHHRLPSSFSGWFPADAVTNEPPKTWKQSMLVVFMLFPVVMLEIRFLTPWVKGLNTSPATFIGNVISVFLLSWPLMPLIIRAMKWWLLPGSASPRWINPVGALVLLVLYAAEIMILARLV